ncbi:hypothetical protein [Burkholderia sp. L27(2015)]|uniref:WapI family immunity protein n=1 Tax=Burkholderia sp. L27(2015) TaxID=1641858 RepID=UPI00131DBE66|nr:hypothetical protein [Burkholderia sp. L27(2015)]
MIARADLEKIDELGDADLRIGGFSLWVHGRQFPEAIDYWDGNWLLVTACYICPDAAVVAHGSFVRLDEISSLADGCRRLYRTLAGEAGLHCLEPNLDITVAAKGLGHFDLRIALTPDQVNQQHLFKQQFDQTLLSSIIASCDVILEQFPMRSENAPIR